MPGWGYFIVCLGLGYVFLRYDKWLVDNIGRSQFVERYMGAGGTYNLWKLVGLAMIVFAFWALMNW